MSLSESTFLVLLVYVEQLLVPLSHIFKLEGKVQVTKCWALPYRENPQ